MGAQEFFDDGRGLLRFRRARTIDQHPAGPQAGSDRIEDLELEFVMSGEHRTLLSPLCFGMPA
jgi:hypothetical protein